MPRCGPQTYAGEATRPGSVAGPADSGCGSDSLLAGSKGWARRPAPLQPSDFVVRPYTRHNVAPKYIMRWS
jgi:hypothetical protein